jgi:hypothetical protein
MADKKISLAFVNATLANFTTKSGYRSSLFKDLLPNISPPLSLDDFLKTLSDNEIKDSQTRCESFEKYYLLDTTKAMSITDYLMFIKKLTDTSEYDFYRLDKKCKLLSAHKHKFYPTLVWDNMTEILGISSNSSQKRLELFNSFSESMYDKPTHGHIFGLLKMFHRNETKCVVLKKLIEVNLQPTINTIELYQKYMDSFDEEVYDDSEKKDVKEQSYKKIAVPLLISVFVEETGSVIGPPGGIDQQVEGKKEEKKDGKMTYVIPIEGLAPIKCTVDWANIPEETYQELDLNAARRITFYRDGSYKVKHCVVD